MTKLNLSNCAGSGMDRLSTPVNYYLEQLANDSTLRALDLTMNRMDFRSALILEDAVQQHRSLRQLQLSDNPLGTRGLRPGSKEKALLVQAFTEASGTLLMTLGACKLDGKKAINIIKIRDSHQKRANQAQKSGKILNDRYKRC